MATLDQLAGPDRLRLGLAPGLRADDFTESGVDFASRGKRLTDLITRLGEVWDSEEIGPRPATTGGPPLLFGGVSDAATRRIVSAGTGWIAGDATIADVEGFAPALRDAWSAAGRDGEPTVIASIMFALGGSEYVDYGIDIAHTTPEDITTAVRDFEKAGVDELIFMGNDADPDQVDLLADVLLSA